MDSTIYENRIICKSAQVSSGGKGFNFQVVTGDDQQPAFVIRHNDTPYAYLNRCAHLFLELDWDTGEFFDFDCEYIICANHGALFEPDTGECINGPCYGMSLTSISILEDDDKILIDDEHFQLVN